MSSNVQGAAATVEVVVFDVGPRRLAVASACVKELVRAVAVTALPAAPVGVDGVIDWRGAIIPVFDLRPRLGLEREDVRASEHFLVCDVRRIGPAAVRTDRVHEILPIGDFLPLPANSSTNDLADSLFRLSDAVIVLCDLARVLESPEIDQLARAIRDLEGHA